MSSDVRTVPPDVTSTLNWAGPAIWLPTSSQTSAISLTTVFEVMLLSEPAESRTNHAGEMLGSFQ